MAQNATSPPAATQQVPEPITLTAAELESLVAPIALYPDPLVAQILMAATYPLEIIEADRWLQVPANAALTADALAAALQKLSWDPSIRSLVPFPQILHMMDTHLLWTEQLGNAFLAQQADVMDAIQRLRQRAQATGSLVPSPRQTVSTQDQEIMIEPASPEVIYVPVYNPWCVYGGWPYPDFPPFFFGTWSGYCTAQETIIVLIVAIHPFRYWAWAGLEWDHHRVRIDPERLNQLEPGHEQFRVSHEPAYWQHDPIHRRRVPYRDPATAARFLGAAHVRQSESGELAPAPTPAAPAEPTVPSVGHGPSLISGTPSPQTAPRYPASPGVEPLGPGTHGTSGAPAPSFHPPVRPKNRGGDDRR